MTLLSDYR